MTKQSLKALKSSIAHWGRLASGKWKDGEGIGPDDCALCKLFYHFGFCNECPVRMRTGFALCKNTPYEDADMESLNGLDSPEFKDAAKKELEFLKSLLPNRRAQQ